MNQPLERVSIVVGQSGARVERVRAANGLEWIEKSGDAADIHKEADILQWCAGKLPVAEVIQYEHGRISMSLLPGVNLTEVAVQEAVACIRESLHLIHSLPVHDCQFSAAWPLRLEQARYLVEAGKVDEDDFDEENLGRSAADILEELHHLPPPPNVQCFTHGDACLPNFLSLNGALSGIVDLGRAGITHPAQDWALALRSMRSNFGPEAETLLRSYIPDHCAEEKLLRQFRLLDELF